MSTVQEQVINYVINMSDGDVKFILEIIERLIPKEKAACPTVSDKMKAFHRLEQLRGGFPTDFDPDKELAEAREEKYGSIDYASGSIPRCSAAHTNLMPRCLQRGC